MAAAVVNVGDMSPGVEDIDKDGLRASKVNVTEGKESTGRAMTDGQVMKGVLSKDKMSELTRLDGRYSDGTVTQVVHLAIYEDRARVATD